MANRGVEVNLFEKDGIAHHASGLAFGIVSPDTGWQKQEEGIINPSFELHNELSTTLPQQSGIDYGFIQKSSVILAFSKRELADIQSRISNSDTLLDADQIKEIEPRVSKQCFGGVLYSQSYQLDTYKFTLSLWYGAQIKGAVMYRSQVSRILTKNRNVIGVEVNGEKFLCDAVVLAAGAWSPQLIDTLEVLIPVVPLKGQILRLAVPGNPLTFNFTWNSNYASSKSDGLVWIGTTEERVGFNALPTQEAREQVLSSAISVFPYLQNAIIARHTACLRPITPDGLPIIDTVSGINGLVVSTGAGRKGISMGPALGKAAADLVMDQHSDIPTDCFKLNRFHK